MGKPEIVQIPDTRPAVWTIKRLYGVKEKKIFYSKEEADKYLQVYSKARKAHKVDKMEHKAEKKKLSKMEVGALKVGQVEHKAEQVENAKRSTEWQESYFTASASESKQTEQYLGNKVKGSRGVIGKNGMTIDRKNKSIPTTEIYAHGCCIDHGCHSDGTPNLSCGIGVYMEPQHGVTTLQTVSEPLDAGRPSPPKAALTAAYSALEIAAKSSCKLIQVKMSNAHTVKSLSDWAHKWGGYKNAKVPGNAIIVNFNELERICKKRNELLDQGVKISWVFVDEIDKKNKLAMSLARAGAQEKIK